MTRFSTSLFEQTFSMKESGTARQSTSGGDSVSAGEFRKSNNSKGNGGMKATFVDATAMKEKVRQNLTKPQYSVKDYYKTSGIWPKIATSTIFESATLGVIALNALWIAIDTDLNDAELLIQAHPVFIVAENLFCLYFFFEWFVRFMSFSKKKYGLRDAWFVFDSGMVLMMVLETWVMTIVLLCIDSGSGGAGDASILRVARLLRLSRMARMARLLRALPELMIMIRGMVAATRSVFFTLCLLIIVMYVFGIAFTQLCAGTHVGTKYFRSVPSAMFTLLIYGTLLDNIGFISQELGQESYIIAFMFFCFVLLAALTVMNMLIGVLCEVVNAVAATEKEEMLVTYVNRKLHRVVQLLDSDGGGTISKTEFMRILENADAVRCLQDVGVDVIGLVDFAEYIFETDNDDEEEEVELDFGKFMEVVLQLRGTNNATVKDIVDLRKFVRQTLMESNKLLHAIAKDQQVIRHKLGVPHGQSVYNSNTKHRRTNGEGAEGNAYDNEMRISLQSQGQKSVPVQSVQLHREHREHREPERSSDKAAPNSSEKLNLQATGCEQLHEPPQQINWPDKKPAPPPFVAELEKGPPPLPLNASPLVHLLQTDFEEDFSPPSEDAEKGPGADTNACSHAPTLKGQWYPHNSNATGEHVVEIVNKVAAPCPATVPALAQPSEKAEDMDTPVPREGLDVRVHNNVDGQTATGKRL